ncbi:MAG: DUF2130 domain-containing protein [Clostridia bacterium]|nr:DUF2130 domain-containing protein [Clostridia bacterium]
MPEIKCPNCGEVFQIDESNYDSIVKQVRDHEFNEELTRREKEFKKEIESAVALAKADTVNSSKDELANKELRIKELEAELKSKEEITKSKVNDALNSSKDKINELELKINSLTNEISLKEAETKNKVSEAISKKDKEILELKSKLDVNDKEARLNEQSIKNKYEADINALNQEIQFYKDFKAKQSTKMVGESLEQHCSYEFNRLRPTAFKNAYFEKDNDAKSGSKGDFIFKDYDDEGTEIVSIMFEMKNEADTTATKHKNEHFFKELDKDRNEKGCEYAILVSLLEADNDLYNEGIVDVSYQYPKMYVIRPQFFIPIITLIRNAALNSLGYKKELAIVKNQDIDVSNFEENMNAFKDAFGRNYELASKKFEDAINEIDKSIDHLQKIKAALTGSENNLRLANNKAQELSIKKLTKNAPSVAEKFAQHKK